MNAPPRGADRTPRETHRVAPLAWLPISAHRPPDILRLKALLLRAGYRERSLQRRAGDAEGLGMAIG